MESIQFYRFSETYNLELVHGRNVDHYFPRHLHRSLNLGLVEEGVRECRYMGTSTLIPAGSVFVINPGEVHSCGTPVGTHHSYRAICVQSDALEQVCPEINGPTGGIPRFRGLIIQDRELYRRTWLFCTALELQTSRLEREDLYLSLLAYLFVNHSEGPNGYGALGRETAGIKLVREYIEANCFEDITTAQLASIARLSPFHLMRVFKKEVGMPPHAYLSLHRIGGAKELLGQGMSIADVASEAGFVDQTHFTRVFKRLVGVTPGRYKKN